MKKFEFVEKNANPKKRKVCDCVVRAISDMKMPKDKESKRYTVERFAKELAKPNTTYIILVTKHLTCLKCGRTIAKLVDTWDCSYKSLGNYYVVNKH